MEQCIFCKIANRELPSEIIWQDENFVAVLDINPVTQGMVLVIPKKHCASYIFKNDDDFIKELMVAAKTVAKMLEKAFEVQKVAVIFEGLEIDHLHVKLFPLREGDFIKKVLTANYPKPTPEELHATALKIIEQDK